MVLGLLRDAALRALIHDAACADEDVFTSEESVLAALRWGFPRLLVRDGEGWPQVERLLEERQVRVIGLASVCDGARASEGSRPPARVGDRALDAARLLPLVREKQVASWVDAAIKDLSRAAGAPLPPALRGFARRVLEFPARYDDLHAFGSLTGLSRGALKARFRRRGLPSPSSYLRWLRVLAAAQVLHSPSMTTLRASQRLGFTTDGNFCRAVATTSGLTPSEIRGADGRQRLLILFAMRHLGREALSAWEGLEPMFLRPSARQTAA